MDEKSASQQIDNIISLSDDWQSSMLARLRAIVLQVDPNITEAVKWKKPSNPWGVPVWMYNGNIIIANVLKHTVRFTFPKGAHIDDPHKLFNTRLDSKTVRAIDFYEDDAIDTSDLIAIIQKAIDLNKK